VYDFGGGTLDVSLLTLESGVFEVYSLSVLVTSKRSSDFSLYKRSEQVSLLTLESGVFEVPPESGPLRAVHLSRHKWPGGVVN